MSCTLPCQLPSEEENTEKQQNGAAVQPCLDPVKQDTVVQDTEQKAKLQERKLHHADKCTRRCGYSDAYEQQNSNSNHFKPCKMPA